MTERQNPSVGRAGLQQLLHMIATAISNNSPTLSSARAILQTDALAEVSTYTTGPKHLLLLKPQVAANNFQW